MRIVSNTSHSKEDLLSPHPNNARLRGKRVWIAGGRGFIGSRLSRILGTEGLLGDGGGLGAQVHHLRGDISDAQNVRNSIGEAQPDFLVNLAAPVDVRRDPDLRPRMNQVILEGLQNVLAAMTELPGRPLLLQCGTCEEYGLIDAPFSEGSEPGAPVSPYAEAKLSATRAALASEVRVVVARPFLTYGPGQRGTGLLPSAIRAALAGEQFEMTQGTHTREFNFVDDIALDLAELLLCPSAEGRVVNLGCGVERQVVEVARLAWQLAGGNPSGLLVGTKPSRPGDIPRLFADVSRARTLLGARPRIPLEDGLKKTIEGFRSTMREEDEHER